MFPCTVCEKSFRRKDSLTRHVREVCNPSKSSSTHSPKKRCLDGDITPKNSTSHQRSEIHTRNLGSVPLVEGIDLVFYAYKSRIMTYRLKNQDSTNLDGDAFFKQIEENVVYLITSTLDKFTAIKVNFVLFGEYILQTKCEISTKSFATRNFVVNPSQETEIFESAVDMIKNKMREFREKDSGWALTKVKWLEVNINKYNPLKASSYIELPTDIKNKKAVLNIQNSDEECFKYCILAHLHPVKDNSHRVDHYKRYDKELCFDNISFPVKSSDILKFEQLNQISVNVYGIEQIFHTDTNKKEWQIIGPIYLTPKKHDNHVNLLLITDDESSKTHYCLIRNMSRLVRSQVSKHKQSKFLCDACLIFFSSKSKLNDHVQNDCQKIVTKLPTADLKKDKKGDDIPGNIVKFQNHEKQLRVPFVIYSDFESILLPIETCSQDPTVSSTNSTHRHQPHSFAYYIKCSYDDSFSKLRKYRGLDAAKVFIEKLEKDIKRLYHNYLKHKVTLKMSNDDKIKFRTSNNCHICDRSFNNDDDPNMKKVRDHDHLTGKFRGAACYICNLNYQIPKFIPIFCHNLSGYDAHLFIKELAENDADLSVIAQNKEKYISFSKKILVHSFENKDGIVINVFRTLRFLDTFRFMPSSLDKLANNLQPDDCHNIRRHFPDEEKFTLIRQKGVFPYSYIDNFEKLNEPKLPTIVEFNDNLNNKNITQEDYQRACRVWNLFDCKTIGDYSDIYLTSDVLLLTDIFENFRNVCISTYGLDPAQYFTAPGLSWDAMLKYTQVELELLTDVDMLHFIKKSIRGGICQCSTRKAIANNPFMPNYAASKDTSYIMYLDATNLYGAAMSQNLPQNSFQWVDTDFKISDISKLSDEAHEGFIFEVDLEYPPELHEYHDDLPFCAENIIPPTAKTKVRKLCPNFFSKTKYILHYRNLKQVLSHGLKLTKIHRVLKFVQSCWLKPYIDLNTEMRNSSKNAFEKDFYKLMNNSVFGKTMESVDKRVNVHLTTHWENHGRKIGAESLIARPNFKNSAVFTENFVAIQMHKSMVIYNKPIFVGFTVLEISKLIMYSFYYDFIKKKYGDKAHLLYTDTDSLILQIYCSYFYEDMKLHLDKFDTSNYAIDNPHGIPVNNSVLGRMKDEYKGNIIWEFYGTGAKAYCVNCEGELTKKAKGVKKNVVVDVLNDSHYSMAASIPGTQILASMTTFHSILHDIYTELKRKVALSYSDDKRCLIEGDYRTHAWGYHKS